MKTIHYLYFYTTVALVLSSCVSRSVTPDAIINTPTALLTATTIPVATMMLEASPTISPVPTEIITPPATLEPEQAKDAIKILLQESVDCNAPCFWGITPSQTTFSEATKVFTHLGLQTWRITRDNTEFYGITHKFDSGLSIMPALTIQNDIVKNISLDITPEIYQKGVPREWLAYSPETLINRYGSPSRVDFFVGTGSPSLSYVMVMYFDDVDLIVEYGGYDIDVMTTSYRVCPLMSQFDSVRVWLGKEPENPPGDFISLQEVASITLDEFSELMSENSDKACINLKQEKFP